MKFINKLFTKAIFSEDSTLNLVAADMGEAQIQIEIGDDVVKRLPSATGTIGSLSIFVPVSVTLSVLKTSPSVGLYLARVLKDGYIGGTLTIYDDVNFPLTISEVSIKTAQFEPANGTSPAVTIIVEGNCPVNTQALSGF